MATQIDSAVQRQVGVLFDAGTMVPLTDGTLIERFASRRDEAAFAAIVERHGPMVLRVCRASLRDEHEAHDAFQAAFLVLVRKARTLWVRDSVGPWLHGVAWRIASRARAAAARRRRHEQRAAEMAPRTLIENREARDVELPLHEEIHRLPDRFRAVVILCDLEGLGTDEAAHRLGTPVGTARSRLARGRERLRTRLIRRGFGPAVVATVTAQTASSATHLPSALAQTTIRAAVEFARVGTVSAHLSWLMKGGHEIMTIKAWTMASLVVATGIVAGAGALVAQTSAKGPTVDKSEAKPASKTAATKDELKSIDTTRPHADEARLQGKWTVLGVQENGREIKTSDQLGTSFVFRGRELEITERTGKFARHWFTIPADSRPKEMQIGSFSYQRPHTFWLYDLDREKLRIALDSKNRPGVRLVGFDHFDPESPVLVLNLVRDSAPPETARINPSPKPDDTKSDKERLQGRWRADRMFQDGQEKSDPNVGKITMNIQGNQIEVKSNTGMADYLFEIFTHRPGFGRISVDRTDKAPKSRASVLYDFTKGGLTLGFEWSGLEQWPKNFDELSIDFPSSIHFVRDPSPASDSNTKPADTAATDLARMQGLWVPSKVFQDGTESDEPKGKGARLLIQGNELFFIGSDRKVIEHDRFEIDESSEPRAIRQFYLGGIDATNAKKTARSIYSFQGDVLRLAWDYRDPTRKPESFGDFGRDGHALVAKEYVRQDPQPKPGTIVPIETNRPDVAQTDFNWLQGRWKAVRMLENGWESRDPSVAKSRMTVEGNKIAIESTKGNAEWIVYEIDEKSEPHAIRVGKSDVWNERAWWIYGFQGDVLRVAFGPAGFDEKPKSFDGRSKESPLAVIDFVRDEPPKAVASADTPKKTADSAATDLKRMQGLWVARKVLVNGKETPNPSGQVFELLIYGDEMTYIVPNRTNLAHYRFEIDASSEPRAIRMLHLDGDQPKDAKKFLCSIYSFQGDVLRMATNNRNYAERPKSFEDYGQAAHVLMTVEYVRQDQQAPKTTVPIESKKVRSDIAESDREELQGRWVVRKAKVNGREVEGSALALATLTFDRNEVLFVVPGQSSKQMAYRIDPDARPKAFRVANLEASLGDPGVWLYNFEYGERGGLKVAFDNNREKPRRPKSFDDFDPARPLTVLELVRDNPPVQAKPTPVTAIEFDKESKTLNVLGPVAVRTPPSTAAETDLERLRGKWKILNAHENGVEANDTGFVLASVTIGPEEIEIDHQTEGKQRFSYQVDPDSDPRALIVVNQKTKKSDWWLYKVEGDKLKIAFDSADEPKRAKGFDKPEPGQLLLVLDLVRDEPLPIAPKLAVGIGGGELARLKGTWKVLAREVNGDDIAINGDENMIISGDALIDVLPTTMNSTVTEVSTFTIDPSRDPKSIDAVRVDGSNDSKPILGIYRIDGPTLTLCWDLKGGSRPIEFDTKPGSGHHLIVLRRKKSSRQPVASPSPSATAK